MTVMLLSITPILICRFIMQLRDIALNEGTSDNGRTWSSIRFVGNMGEDLRAPGEDEDEERWDDELPHDPEEQQEGSNNATSSSEFEREALDHGVGGDEVSIPYCCTRLWSHY